MTNGSASIQSMTGYSVLELRAGGESYRAHLKSVNHRHFELKWRAPRAWMPFEIDAKGRLQAKLSRGTVECWIEAAPKEAVSQETQGAQVLLLRLQKAVGSAKGLSRFTLPPFVRALVLARFPELWWDRETEARITKEEASAALEKLADGLVVARRAEGEKLAKLILGSAQGMGRSLDAVRERLPGLQEQARKDLLTRLNALAEEFKIAPATEQRVLQEFLILAEKRDVAEELGRIRIHLGALEELLASPPPQCGKRIEFLAQELHREWTTLGTKVHDPSVTAIVIDAKLELDRIREQAANLA